MTVDCPKTKDFMECTNQIEGDFWNSYTIFYTHADNVCFFYKSLEWYEQSDNMVNKLANYSVKLAELTYLFC